MAREAAQVALGVERRHATHARRGDGLAIHVVGDVAGREHAGHVGLRAAGLDDEIAVFIHRERTPLTFFSPSTRVTIVFQMNLILGFLNARSCMAFDARNWSRRCTTWTTEPNLVK